MASMQLKERDFITLMWENVPYYIFYLCASSSLSAPIHASEKKKIKISISTEFSELILQIESPGKKKKRPE